MKYLIQCCIVGLLLLCATGCNTMKTKENVLEFNPVIYDENFQKAFENRTIKVVAASSGTDLERMAFLRTLPGLNIEIPGNLISEAVPFHANSDEERFKFLKSALFDKSSKTIIWSLRGGYGSAKLISWLKKLPKPKHEKIFIGFSDTTALHLFLSQHWGWKSIHGSGVTGFLSVNQDPENLKRIADIVSKRVPTLELTHLEPLNETAKNSKKITGTLTGGNLAIIQTSIGTDWQIKADGKILFLEDQNEKGYTVDRALNHLKQAGILKKVKAIVFGNFTPSADEHVDFALQRFANENAIPVFKTDEFGHDKKNYPLIYNAKSKIVIHPNSSQYDLIMDVR